MLKINIFKDTHTQHIFINTYYWCWKYLYEKKTPSILSLHNVHLLIFNIYLLLFYLFFIIIIIIIII